MNIVSFKTSSLVFNFTLVFNFVLVFFNFYKYSNFKYFNFYKVNTTTYNFKINKQFKKG